MSRAGYSVADLTELANYPANYRREDQPIAVGSENCWYIYKPAETAAEDLPDIVEPTDNNGRYLRMHQAASGGGGGGAAVPIVSSPPTGTPSAIGALAAQNEQNSGTYSFSDFYDPQITRTLDWEFTRRCLWVATGLSGSSWRRISSQPSILEYTNVAAASNDPDQVVFTLQNDVAIREFLGVHPAFEGEQLTIFYRSTNGLAYSCRSLIAVAIAPDIFWPIGNTSYTPSVSPNLHWLQLSVDAFQNDPNWYN